MRIVSGPILAHLRLLASATPIAVHARSVLRPGAALVPRVLPGDDHGKAHTGTVVESNESTFKFSVTVISAKTTVTLAC